MNVWETFHLNVLRECFYSLGDTFGEGKTVDWVVITRYVSHNYELVSRDYHTRKS